MAPDYFAVERKFEIRNKFDKRARWHNRFVIISQHIEFYETINDIHESMNPFEPFETDERYNLENPWFA